MNTGQRTVAGMLAVVAVMLGLNLIVRGSPTAVAQVASGSFGQKEAARWHDPNSLRKVVAVLHNLQDQIDQLRSKVGTLKAQSRPVGGKKQATGGPPYKSRCDVCIGGWVGDQPEGNLRV